MKRNQMRYTVKPEIDSLIMGIYAGGSRLIDCEWDKAEFRLPGRNGDYAVNVKVTGRTVQYPYGVSGGAFVRCAVTFVADKAIDWYTGEMVGEDVTERAWLKIEGNQYYTCSVCGKELKYADWKNGVAYCTDCYPVE